MPITLTQPTGWKPTAAATTGAGETNRLGVTDRAAHDWYRFILAFPPHLVRSYLDNFGVTLSRTVLDPFSGTGTTVVECKKQGVPSIGVEACPMSKNC